MSVLFITAAQGVCEATVCQRAFTKYFSYLRRLKVPLQTHSKVCKKKKKYFAVICMPLNTQLVDLGSVLNRNVVTRRPVGMLSEFSLFWFYESG